jgi:molybdopterin molybdotransferase
MLQKGQDCWPILTGGSLPDNTDAVVMLEYAEELEDGTVLAYRPVAPAENVIAVGEDIPLGDCVVPAGVIITPRHIAMLAALGNIRVNVFSLRVALFSTGHEILNLESTLEAGKVRDINSYYLHALLREEGFEPEQLGILPDDEDILFSALSKAVREYDAVVLSGGSSAGALDYSRRVLDRLGSPGVLTHGLAIKPGKPTLIAVTQGKPVLALPGHPLSCALTARFVALPLLHAALGSQGRKRHTVTLPMARPLSSVPGRRDFIPVRIVDGEVVPLMSKSAAISALGYSDGVLTLPENCEGLARGAEVEIELWGGLL